MRLTKILTCSLLCAVAFVSAMPAIGNAQDTLLLPNAKKEAAPKSAKKEQSAEVKDAKDAKPDPLKGDWKLQWVDQNKSTSFRVENVTRGLVGAAMAGTLTGLDGKSCAFNATIIDRLSGLYPDGARILSMEIAGHMRVVAKCENAPITVDAFMAGATPRAVGRLVIAKQGAQPDSFAVILTR